MLILSSRDDGFADDADPARIHRLPTSLQPSVGSDGVPEVTLARTADGGVLSLRLVAQWEGLAAHEQPVPLTRARFRLHMRAPSGAESGRWHDTSPFGRALVDRSVPLDRAEAAIAEVLLAEGRGVVEVEVELLVSGRTPTFPWIARVEQSRLRDLLRAMLGPDPVEWARVEDAFAGLPMDLFVWHPLELGAPPPPVDDALRALARHAAAVVLEATDDGWRVGPAAEGMLDLGLAVPRDAARWFGLTWSMSEFLAAQPDPSRHVIEVTTPAPFEAAVLQLVNDVPLAPAAIPRITVEVLTGGPTGRLDHTFEVGAPSAVRLPFVRQTTDPLALQWRARATVVTARGTGIVETDRHPAALALRIDAASLGLTPLRFVAEPEVFEHAVALEVELGARTLRLTAASPEAWAVGRRAPATVTVIAVTETDARVELGTMPLGPWGLTIGAARLGVGETVEVTIRPPPHASRCSAYLAVQVEGGPWRTLDPEDALRWTVRRQSRLVRPRLRYRTRHVPRGEDGHTAPIVESPWREGEGEGEGEGKVVEMEVELPC